MKKILCSCCCIWAIAVSSFSLDLSVRLRPFLSIPLGQDSDLYTVGGGADAIFDIDISSIVPNSIFLGYSAGAELGLNFVPVKSTGNSMQLLSFGLAASAFYYPGSRISVRGGGGLGFYEAFYKGSTHFNLYWNLSGEAGFRFTPNFILSGAVGYRHHRYNSGDPLYSGLFAGVIAQFQFQTASSEGDVAVQLTQGEAIFPLFFGLYQQNPVGTLRITNNESAEIRNVTVSFRAGNYTSSQYLCGTIPVLGKRKNAEVPLLADFSPLVLNFSENGRIPGEVVIRYELLGKERITTQTAVISVYNRNSFRWTDSAALASFVSPSAPEVLDYTRYTVGIARNRLRTGLNQNMQFAMYLYEGLRTAGIVQSQDAQTPYVTYHRDMTLVDFIQFPFQTMAYRSGDLDDLGLLYAASLEAAGIKAALIPLKDDFIVIFSLGIDENQALNLFNGLDKLLVLDGIVWMPVSLAFFREGFINSWYGAVNALNRDFETGEEVDVIILQDTWSSYPPAAINAQEAQLDKPAENPLVFAVETNMMRYISSEFGPKIAEIRDEIQLQGGSAVLYNRLGLLYVRSGMYREAKLEYGRSAAMGSVAAMINLGNIGMLEQDLDAAEMWYSRALEADPGNRTARNGLNQIAIERMD